MTAGSDSLTRRSALNTGAAFLAYLVRLGLGLVVSPLLLGLIGPNIFGLWQICQRLLTYVESAEGRGTQALKWILANSQKAGDDDGRHRAVGSAVVIWLLFLPVVCLVGLLVVWLGPHFIRDLDPAFLGAVRWACAILVMRLMLMGVAQIPEAVLQGMNVGYLMTWPKIILELSGAALLLAAAWLGFGLPGLAVSFGLVAGLGGVLLHGVAKRHVPWYGASRPSREDVKGFFGFSAWVFAWTFVNKILLFSDVIVLGMILNAEAVTHYTLTLYPAQLGVHFSAMLVSAAVPGFGGLIGSGEWVRARAARAELLVILWLFLLVLGSGVLLLNESFITLWVGPENYCGPLVNLALVVMVVQQVLFRADAFLIDTTLDIRAKVMAGTVAALVGVLAAYFLGRRLGVVGVIAGFILGRTILTVYLPHLMNKVTGISSKLTVAGFGRMSGVMILTYGAFWKLGQHWRAGNWPVLVLAGLGTLLVAGTAGYFLGLNRTRQQAINGRLVVLRRFLR